MLIGNQPWPQFQNGIREKSIGIIFLRLSKTSSIWGVGGGGVVKIQGFFGYPNLKW